ncbi:MAG: hypothetical protein N7Q72_06150, partial [Spiroplasma sp. Tabriz.8]|nr:hypothetical protein [Spiroplasma sp. Tabriz.8]
SFVISLRFGMWLLDSTSHAFYRTGSDQNWKTFIYLFIYLFILSLFCVCMVLAFFTWECAIWRKIVESNF